MEVKMNNKDPCFGCNTNTKCLMRNLLISKDFKKMIEACPCVECLVKPSCNDGCNDRHRFSSMYARNNFEKKYYGK